MTGTPPSGPSHGWPWWKLAMPIMLTGVAINLTAVGLLLHDLNDPDRLQLVFHILLVGIPVHAVGRAIKMAARMRERRLATPVRTPNFLRQK